eukprot:8057041-Pyramimonas_sp.AAC.1
MPQAAGSQASPPTVELHGGPARCLKHLLPRDTVPAKARCAWRCARRAATAAQRRLVMAVAKPTDEIAIACVVRNARAPCAVHSARSSPAGLL